jgi:5,10-methylenetetrahydrofolate reductase
VTLGQVASETILHMCCRDRNLLGLMSDLLGNHSRGLHNMVVITGVRAPPRPVSRPLPACLPPPTPTLL